MLILLLFELRAVDLGIDGTGAEQFFVGADSGYLAVLQHHDLQFLHVGVLHLRDAGNGLDLSLSLCAAAAAAE